jgi:hypothetical protein
MRGGGPAIIDAKTTTREAGDGRHCFMRPGTRKEEKERRSGAPLLDTGHRFIASVRRSAAG